MGLGKTSSELDELLSPEEIMEYKVWFSREPVGWERLDYLVAHLAQVIIACNSETKPRFEDCLLKFRTPRSEMTEEEKEEEVNRIIRSLKLGAAMHNGTLNNGQ